MVESIFCVHCLELFPPRNRKQSYCTRPVCQRARKAAWERIKIKTDPDYRAQKRLSQKKWAQNHPGYWKKYRSDNPKKTERNRILQIIRNRRRARRKLCLENKIAKSDARNCQYFEPLGRFWLVPMIAKMDAAKVNIYTIRDSW